MSLNLNDNSVGPDGTYIIEASKGSRFVNYIIDSILILVIFFLFAFGFMI